MLSLYRDDFHFGDWGIASCEANMNFADKSACLTVNNIQTEVVPIHRSQVKVKLSLCLTN
jgi:hypothetical protein